MEYMSKRELKRIKKEIKLSYSEFLETMQKHSCPSCSAVIGKEEPCNDECIECYITYLINNTKTKKDMKI